MSFSIPWSAAQQERLADLVADRHELPEIMRRMPGHPKARLIRKIAEIQSKPEDGMHLADAAATPADPAPVVREHDAAPDHTETTAFDPPAGATIRSTQDGPTAAAPVTGPSPAGAAAPRFAITLDARARHLLDAMAAATGKRPARLAAELLTAVLEDDAAAHRDSEVAA
jgi:hypothetical protein